MKIAGGYLGKSGYCFLIIIVVGLISASCLKPVRRISICKLQGSGLTSPFNEQEVIVSGIVTVDLPDNTPGGFFIQDVECSNKSINGISSGVFIVSEANYDRVSIGDEVSLRGIVVEFSRETSILAREDSIQISSVANPLPDEVELVKTYQDDGVSLDYESSEGMLVILPAARVVKSGDMTGNFWVSPDLLWNENDNPDDMNGTRNSLRISHDQTNHHLNTAVVGDYVEHLAGVLRQDRDEYLLQLIEPARVVLKPAIDHQVIEITEKIAQDGREDFEYEYQEEEIKPSSTPIPTVTPTTYPVNLLITEILPNPKGREPDGEWIEIYNPDIYALPLTGIKVGDETTQRGKEGMLRFPDGYYIEANQVLVIAHNAAAFRSRYGFFPDFEFVDSDDLVPDMLPYSGWGGSSVQLSNGGDEVMVLDPWDKMVDLVCYGNTTFPTFHPAIPAPKEEQTLERYPPDKDRDKAGDWRVRSGGSPGKLDWSPPTQAASPTPSGEPTTEPSPAPSGTSTPFIPSATPAPVRLLISEVMANPLGDEPEGEWVEIYNPDIEPMPLTGVKIGDAAYSGDPEGMLVFPPGEVIKPGGLVLIAFQSTDFEMEYGFKPDYEISFSDSDVKQLLPYKNWAGEFIRFSNLGDEVVLLNGWNEIVDALAYGASTYEFFQPPVPTAPEGRSLVRVPHWVDTNSAADWEVAEDPSPGKPNVPLLTSTPGTSPSPSSTLTPGVTVSGTPTVTPSITSSPWISLTQTMQMTPSPATSPSQSSTITPTTTTSHTPTIMPSPSQSSEPSPSLSSTATPMKTATPVIPTATDTVTPSPSREPTITPGLSLTGSSTTDPTIAGTTVPTASITPIQPSSTPTPTSVEDPLIVLNEIHADPDPILGDANGDGVVHRDDDEFLELINLGESTLDLSGWVITDGVRTRYTFPPGLMISGHCGLIIFGGGSPTGDFGGSLVQVTGTLALNNTGDTVSLWDLEENLRLRISYGMEGGLNQSLTRYPDLTGSLPLTLHGEINPADNTLYSPGVKVDGTVFGICP